MNLKYAFPLHFYYYLLLLLFEFLYCYYVCRFQSVDKMVEYLKSNCALKSSITRNAIDNVMSISSTCQLQLLEVSLQCPLSKSKINIPIKTKTCQHLGCFDAKTFLSVMMMKKQPKCWKCPVSL